MGEVNYLPLIEEMSWSYSRIESFESCPYGFFMRYISHCKSVDKFFATYGSWMHKIIERYYAEGLSKDAMLIEFITKFESQVRGVRPKSSTVQKYIEGAVNYLKHFEPFQCHVLEVEKNVTFEINDIEFVGRIDIIGENDGDLCIIDHKSGDIKPRSTRKKPTIKDRELDTRLRQLYLYSTAVKEIYGQFPKSLCFNCFRVGEFIRESFDIESYNRTIEWAMSEIEAIKNTADFYPKCNIFYCKYICGLSEDCIYDQMPKEDSRTRW